MRRAPPRGTPPAVPRREPGLPLWMPPKLQRSRVSPSPYNRCARMRMRMPRLASRVKRLALNYLLLLTNERNNICYTWSNTVRGKIDAPTTSPKRRAHQKIKRRVTYPRVLPPAAAPAGQAPGKSTCSTTPAQRLSLRRRRCSRGCGGRSSLPRAPHLLPAGRPTARGRGGGGAPDNDVVYRADPARGPPGDLGMRSREGVRGYRRRRCARGRAPVTWAPRKERGIGAQRWSSLRVSSPRTSPISPYDFDIPVIRCGFLTIDEGESGWKRYWFVLSGSTVGDVALRYYTHTEAAWMAPPQPWERYC